MELFCHINGWWIENKYTLIFFSSNVITSVWTVLTKINLSLDFKIISMLNYLIVLIIVNYNDTTPN